MRTSQSKKASFVESVVNTAIGFVITWIFSPLIYWACDVTINTKQVFLATLLFTALSIARNYVIRRWFNNLKWKSNKEEKKENLKAGDEVVIIDDKSNRIYTIINLTNQYSRGPISQFPPSRVIEVVDNTGINWFFREDSLKLIKNE